MLGASQLPQQVGVKGQKLKREDEREESEERRGCWWLCTGGWAEGRGTPLLRRSAPYLPHSPPRSRIWVWRWKVTSCPVNSLREPGSVAGLSLPVSDKRTLKWKPP